MPDFPPLPNISIMGGGRLSRYHLLDESEQLHLDDPHTHHTRSIVEMTQTYLRQQAAHQLESDYSRRGFLHAFDSTSDFFSNGRAVQRSTNIFQCFEAVSRDAIDNPQPPLPGASSPSLGDVVTAVRSNPAFRSCVDEVSRQNTGLMHTITSHLAIADDPEDGYHIITPSQAFQLPSASTFISAGRVALRPLMSHLHLGDSIGDRLIGMLPGNEVEIPVLGLAATTVHLTFNDDSVDFTITTNPVALMREFWPSSVAPTVSDHILNVQVFSNHGTDIHGTDPMGNGVMFQVDIGAVVDTITHSRH